MSLILTTPITGPAAWTRADFANDDAWLIHFTPEHIAEIDAALAMLKAKGLGLGRFGASDFPLPQLARLLHTQCDVLENGRGFFVLRGLPVERYTPEELQAIYYGMGLHMGTPVGQNPRGDLLGRVEAVGDIHNKNTRVYETNLYLPYHCDPSDVVGLLCVRKAPVGGLSSLVSVAAIYNEILAKHREFLGLFYRPMHFAHLCEPMPSLSPIFSFHLGKLSCRYLRQYLELGHEIMGQPLSRVEIEALDLFDHLMHQERLKLDMMLEPGDLQFANNYAVLHSRTELIDHDEVAQRRLLLRLWLKMPNARQLAPEFPGRNGFALPAQVA